jgi:hypothetical protein
VFSAASLLAPRWAKIMDFVMVVYCLNPNLTLPLYSVSLNTLIMRHPSSEPQTGFSRAASD